MNEREIDEFINLFKKQRESKRSKKPSNRNENSIPEESKKNLLCMLTELRDVFRKKKASLYLQGMQEGNIEYFRMRELAVLYLLWGADGKKCRTLTEAGEELGLSRERIRQIEACAYRRLRTERNPSDIKLIDQNWGALNDIFFRAILRVKGLEHTDIVSGVADEYSAVEEDLDSVNDYEYPENMDDFALFDTESDPDDQGE